jgi:hypothetical protein
VARYNQNDSLANSPAKLMNETLRSFFGTGVKTCAGDSFSAASRNHNLHNQLKKCKTETSKPIHKPEKQVRNFRIQKYFPI